MQYGVSTHLYHDARLDRDHLVEIAAHGFSAVEIFATRTHVDYHDAQVLAELRGVIDEAGGSPFWDGLAGRFFGMNFQDADQFNAIHGHQFIADLFPKHPVYIAMLSEHARATIGLPHPSGRAAMRMLENEGFAHEQYIDIFDGGPTMTARTDNVRTIRDARPAKVVAIDDDGGEQALIAYGRLSDFRTAYGRIRPCGDGIALSRACATALGVIEGDDVSHVGRL